MKWNYYSKRRNVSLVDYIKGRNIESYENLTEVLALQDIQPPELGMFQSAYAIAFPPPKSRKRTATKKPAAPKAVSKPKTKPAAVKRKRTPRKK